MPKKGQLISTHKRRQAFVEHLKTLGPGPECVTWPFTTQTGTYALTRDAEGRNTTAHRWVFEQINGPLFDLEACHSCDNPPCVRPSHLWAGTHGENLRDAYRKGRRTVWHGAPPGEAHPNARLTAVEVLRIRELCKQGVSQAVIAKSFGISRPAVSRIHKRTLWRSLPE